MALASYVAQVAEDLGREPDLHIQGSVVEERDCSGSDDGTTGGGTEAESDLTLVMNGLRLKRRSRGSSGGNFILIHSQANLYL